MKLLRTRVKLRMSLMVGLLMMIVFSHRLLHKLIVVFHHSVTHRQIPSQLTNRLQLIMVLSILSYLLKMNRHRSLHFQRSVSVSERMHHHMSMNRRNSLYLYFVRSEIEKEKTYDEPLNCHTHPNSNNPNKRSVERK